MGRTWQLDLGRLPKISLNGRLHWAQRNRLTHIWHATVQVEARRQRIPMLDRAQIRLYYMAPDNRKRDEDNLSPMLKASADALVRYGVLSDDSPEFCRMEMPRIVPPAAQKAGDEAGSYRLVVVELDGQQ